MIIDASKIPSDMGTTVLKMLCIIADRGPMTPTELAKEIGCTTANMTGRLDAAYLCNVLTREQHKTDRRKLSVVMTKEGAALISKLKPALAR